MDRHASRVLVVEDDAPARQTVALALQAEDLRVHAVADGTGIDALLSDFQPDLLVLDVRLPVGPDGFEIARRARGVADLPLLFLTAADGLEERLAGFDAGADDYLVKPFAIEELVARVKALLRRSGRLVASTVEVRDLVVDHRTRAVRRGDAVLALTPVEYELLHTLACRPGLVHSKRQLLSDVWGFDAYDPNLVEVHISALRRKLEAHGPRLIHTERGQGYVIWP